MSVFKGGKYWVVQFNHKNKTYTRSSKSTRKKDALEVLGHRELIKLYEACDALLATNKGSSAYSSLRTAVN